MRSPWLARLGFGETARSGAINFAGSAVGNLAGFVLVALVTRSLGLTRAGLFFESIAVVTTLVAVASWGAPVALMRFVSRHENPDSPPVRRLLFVASVPPLVLSAALASLLVLLSSPLARALAPADQTGPMADLLRAAAAAIPLLVSVRLAVSASRGLGQSAPAAVFDLGGQPLLRLVLCGAVLIADGPLWALGACWSAAALVGGVGAGITLARRVATVEAADLGAPLRRGAGPIGLWRFAAPRGLEEVVQISANWLMIVLVGALAGPEPAAVYTAVSRFTVALTIFLQATVFAVAPRFSQLFAAGDLDAARSLYRVSCRALVTVSYPFAGLIIFFPGSSLRILDAGYASPGAAPLVVLGVATLVNLASGPVGAVILMAGRSTWNLGNAIAAVAATWAVAALLVPAHGALGAAIAWGIGIVAQNALAWWQVFRHWQMPPISASTVLMGSAALACAAVGKLLADLLDVGGITALVVGTVVTLALYAGVLAVTRTRLSLSGAELPPR